MIPNMIVVEISIAKIVLSIYNIWRCPKMVDPKVTIAFNTKSWSDNLGD
jgi:hypothetical protein